MSQRINYTNLAAEAINILRAMEEYIQSTQLKKSTIELIKVRASQLNECAFCLNMHTEEARELGETEQRLYCLTTWRDCDFYTPEEKLALELTEHITLVASKGVSDELYERVREHYDEQQYVDLVLTINQINSWNRIQIAMGVTI